MSDPSKRPETQFDLRPKPNAIYSYGTQKE
jgi:hypothetical protein